jgi:nitroimidazol reductase NimA-like FMN-containing flavoprotein (pyridoxamine 5'-phosphate oxidase superfamily)
MSAPDHAMRRRDRELSEAEAWAILDKASWGVLATVGWDGWPYAVPLNHALVDGALLLHCATSGHKLDNLASDTRVSYCVVTESEVLPAELSTRYESAIVFGRASLIHDEAAKREALQAFGQRFAAEHPEAVTAEIDKDLFRTAVLRISVERVTGKARR